MTMLHKTLTLGLATVLMLGAGCAGMHGASDEELLTDLLETWATAFQAVDAETTLALYSEDYESEYTPNKAAMRQFLESDRAQDFLSQMDIDTTEAQTTIEGDTATIEPIHMGQFSLSLSLAKESDGWKIVNSGMSQ